MIKHQRQRKFGPAPIPTPEEIAERMAAIRDSWDEVTERHRRGTWDQPAWTPPVTEVVMPGNTAPSWPTWPL